MQEAVKSVKAERLKARRAWERRGWDWTSGRIPVGMKHTIGVAIHLTCVR